MDRRTFAKMALALGATAAFGDRVVALPDQPWRERRDRFPEGVASADPDSTSVLLWMRCPHDGRQAGELRVEVAEDAAFDHVVAAERAPVSEAADWTCRVLVVTDFHVPATLDDYRAVYRAYLHDPDLQDARARWPFVNMWDNHELF